MKWIIRRWWLIILIALLLFVAFAAWGAVVCTWDGDMYVVEETVTFTWAPSPDATYYKVQAVWIDPQMAVPYDIGTTTEDWIQVPAPRAGHFYLRVQACNDYGCSRWAETINPADTETGKPFRLYFRLPRPTGVVVE